MKDIGKKIIALSKLRNKMKAQYAKYDLLCQEEKTLMREIEPNCPHSFTENFNWEHDNGYGVQKKCIAKRCILCGSENKYGSWYHPRDIY